MAASDVFQDHRGLLIGVAYRVLGSATETEDVVQDAWLRWSKVDLAEVADPRAFLVTTVTRLAIDRLRQAKARRETYPGTWLPEPVSTPPDAVERGEAVELAVLVMLETLSPLERAVFVLREAFQFPFTDIAQIVGRAEPAVRQLAKRAREHVEKGQRRFIADRAEQREMTERFLAASAGGDIEALTALLARDVALVSDGGGKAKAPLRTIEGADKVVRFLTSIATDQGARAFTDSIGMAGVTGFAYAVAEVNAAPALVVYADTRPIVVLSLVVADGLIREIYLIANPEKLGHVTSGPGPSVLGA